MNCSEGLGLRYIPRAVNMENFITGYPGHEYQARAALKKVLGADKYEFFFDKVRLEPCARELSICRC